MIDKVLARRVLNKLGKELVNAFTMAADQEQREQLQKAINDLTFIYDILHLDDIEVIDISKKPTN